MSNYTQEFVCGLKANTSYFDVPIQEFNSTSPCIPLSLYAPTMLLVAQLFVIIPAGTCGTFFLVISVLLIPKLRLEARKSSQQTDAEKALNRLYEYSCIFGILASIVQATVAARGFFFTIKFDTFGGAFNAVGFITGQCLGLVCITAFVLIFQQLTIMSLEVPMINLPNSDRVVCYTIGFGVFATVVPALVVGTGWVSDPLSYMRVQIPLGLIPVVIFGYTSPLLMKPVLDSIEAVLGSSSGSSTKSQPKKFSLRNSLRTSKLGSRTESKEMSQMEKSQAKLRKARRNVRFARTVCIYLSYSAFVINTTMFLSPLIRMPHFILVFEITFVFAQIQVLAVAASAMFQKYQAVKSVEVRRSSRVVPSRNSDRRYTEKNSSKRTSSNAKIEHN